MSKQGYKPHILALGAQFVMGNAVVTLPFYKSKNTFFVFLLSAIATAIFMMITSFAIKFGAKSKAVFYVTAIAVCLLAVYGAATATYDYLHFVKSEQMPQTNIVLIAIGLLVVLTVFVISSNNAIYKYCFLSAVISAAFIIITFIGGIKSFDMSQLKAAVNFSFDTLPDALKMFLHCFSSLAAAVMFVWLTKKEAHQKTLFFGVSAGFVATALCLVQSILVLGTASDSDYPYTKAVGVISSGSLFTRLDGLVYWVFFAAVLVRTAVCLKTVLLIIKTVFCKKEGAVSISADQKKKR